MSWISDGFSSLTGQITSFTKDVISEATEEIEDPVTELQVAKKTIEDLGNENAQLKLEYDRLKKRNEEVSERADTAEFQVGTISQEYRKLLQQKEDEVKNLKEEVKGQQRKLVTLASNNSLKDLDPQQGIKDPLALSSSTPKPPVRIVIGGRDEDGETLEWMEGWGEDMVGVGLHGLEPESQGDISQLQSDLVRMQVECQHWKELAQQRNAAQADVVLTDDVGNQDEVETLKRQLASLQQESMQHHHELAAMQSLHSQQLESLSLRHQQELLKIQEELTADDSGQEHSQGVASFKQQNHEGQNEMLTAMNQRLQKENQMLREKLASNEVASQELRRAVNALREQISVNESGNVDHLHSESSLISSCVQDIQSAIHIYQTNIQKLQHQQNLSEDEAKSLQSQVESLSNEIESKQHEILSLQEALLQVKESPQKSISPGSSQEWEEEEVSRLRQELYREQAQREWLQTHLSQVQAEHNQELAELQANRKELSSEMHSLRDELNTSVQSVHQASGQAESLQKENIQLQNELEQMRQRALELQSKLSAAELERTSGQNAVETELQSLRHEKSELARALELEKDSLAHERKESQHLKLSLERMEQEMRTVQKSVSMMEKKLQERDSETVDLQKQLEERDMRMYHLKQEHSHLVADNTAKSISLSEHQGLLADAVHAKEELERQLSSLQDQISELQEQGGKEKSSEDWEAQQTKGGELEQVVEHAQQEASHKPIVTESTASSSLAKEVESAKQLCSQLSAENQRLEEELGKVTKELEKETKEKNQFLLKMRNSDKLRREADSRVEMMVIEGDRYQQELRRLREHLLKVEDQHTQELLQADENENKLQQQLKTIQEELTSTTTRHSEHNLQMQQKVVYLEEQVHLATMEKDHVLSELLHAQEEAEQSKTAVHNLQTVLEQFQKDKALEVSLALEQTREELAQVHNECQRLRELHKTAQEEEDGRGETSTLDLRQEIMYKDQRIAELTAELERFRDTLNKSRVTIEHLSSEEDNKVDRQLVKNLFLGYLSSQAQKKIDVIKLIGKILEFSPQELDQASSNVIERGGWITGWMRRKPAHSPIAPEQPSFSQLFVSFLETESAPSTPVSLSHPSSQLSSSSQSHPKLPSHLHSTVSPQSRPQSSVPVPSLTTPARPVTMISVPPMSVTATSEQSSSAQHLRDILETNDH